MILQFRIRRELPAALAERTLLVLRSARHGCHGVDGTLGFLRFLVHRAVHTQFLTVKLQKRCAFWRLFRLRIDHRWHRLLLFRHSPRIYKLYLESSRFLPIFEIT